LEILVPCVPSDKVLETDSEDCPSFCFSSEERLSGGMWKDMLLAVARMALTFSELILFSVKRFVEYRLSEFPALLRDFFLESDLSA
jgi:hypothetical protein